MKSKRLLTNAFALSVLLPVAAMAGIDITSISPTPLFPKVKEGEPLKQVARLSVDNAGEAAVSSVHIAVTGKEPYTEVLGQLQQGPNVKDIHILDIDKPAKVTVEVFTSDGANPVASKTVNWLPQKKWTVYCVSYCHQDLGFGDYPHRLRTTIRHANIRLPLQYCRETDTWPFATYAREVGFCDLFHGYNRLANPDILDGNYMSADADIEKGIGRSIYLAQP